MGRAMLPAGPAFVQVLSFPACVTPLCNEEETAPGLGASRPALLRAPGLAWKRVARQVAKVFFFLVFFANALTRGLGNFTRA
jgi:hypothetical protein